MKEETSPSEQQDATDAEAAAYDPSTLPAAAQRALAEAKERRKQQDDDAARQPKEYGGRDGPEPVRFGDWEKKGIAIDF